MEFPFSFNDPKYVLLLLSLIVVVFLGRLSAAARPRDAGRINLSTGLRSVILLFIVLAVSGLQLITNGGPLNVVFLLDESGSISASERDAASAFVSAAASRMGPDDRMGVVRFGEQAIVDSALSDTPSWHEGQQKPSQVATNIEEAIQLAGAIFPEEGSRRIVLLTDGRETTGQASSLARTLKEQGIQLSVVPLGTESANEVAVDEVLSPRSVPAGQKFDVRVLIKTTSDRDARVTLYDGDQEVARKDVRLKQGDNVVDFTVDAGVEGFHGLRAQVSSADDRSEENNSASSFTIVRPPPSVLVLASAPRDGEPIKRALEASRINVALMMPGDLPLVSETLSRYDSVILANVSSQSMSSSGQLVLQRYVRDTGRGLIMIGGDVSFGAGGYLRSPIEEALPVSMDVRTSTERASLAMTFVVDKSGSMGRCHGGGGTQQVDPAVRTEFGVNKLDIIKQAIAEATSIMNATDQVGIVAFDSAPVWLVNIQQLGMLGNDGLRQSLQPVIAQGDTQVHAGLQTALNGLKQTNAQLKHMVLLSDGWTKQADFNDLLAEVRASGITLTTVAAGEGTSQILKDLAAKGGGEYYEVKDIRDVQDILLKETVRVTGSYYVEEKLTPQVTGQSPILNGLTERDLPALLGYNSTTIKANAEVILRSPRGDPLLAQWQYGLGRSVAWTPDATGRWAADWVRWSAFPQFMAQMVNWTLPQEESAGIAASVTLKPGASPASQDAFLRVESVDGLGLPRNFLTTTVAFTTTTGLVQSLSAAQTSPGEYNAVASALVEGVYPLSIEQIDQTTGQRVGQVETGIVVPYPSEYRLSLEAGETARRLINQLVSATGGKIITLQAPERVWDRDVVPQPRRVPLWPWLLVAAILMFPLDVAIRRLTVSRSDIKRLLSRGKSA